jgi:hypothetical protein
MAIVRRSPHPWWVLLVTIAGSMLATADASAREMAGKCLSSLQPCSRPCVVPYAGPNTGDGFCAAPGSDGVQDNGPSRVSTHRLAVGGRSDGRSTLRPSRNPRPHFDAEGWEDRNDGDDDTDVPVRAWFRDMVSAMDVIPAAGDWRSTSIDVTSDSSRSYQRLRC